MASFPSALIILPREHGGLGFPDIVRLVAARKLAVALRVGARDDSYEVTLSLVYRRARSMGVDPPVGHRFSFPGPLDSGVYWIDSIIEYAHACGGALMVGGCPSRLPWTSRCRRESLRGKKESALSVAALAQRLTYLTTMERTPQAAGSRISLWKRARNP